LKRKGKTSSAGAAAPAVPPPAQPHDVRPGQSVELLKQLHILTRDGKLNQDSRRKLKQVYHLFQFIEGLLQELPDTPQGPTLADHGAGKSYLGFITYDLYLKALGRGTSTASRRAANWWSPRVRWRSAWASSACSS
jgi:hypothetical protein